MQLPEILVYKSKKVNIYKVPLPRKVGKYAGVILYDASSSSSQLTPSQIKKIEQIFKRDEITEVQFYSRTDTVTAKPEETPIYREMLQKFPVLQTKRISSEILTQNQKIKLNFFPTWTENKERAQLVLEGRYYEVMPTSAEIVPTLNCIFRCQQCSFEVTKKILGVWEKNTFTSQFHMTSWDTMEKILQGLKEGGVESVVFTGGGSHF
jgi:2-iminoacetate synthase ThiH